MSTTIETNAILLLSLAAVFLDPLFFYIPLVKNDSTCLGLDNNLRIIVVVFRSLVDVLYTILWWHHILPLVHRRYHSLPLVQGRYRLILARTVAILAILPLPQVVIFAVSGQLLTVLEFIVLIQLIIRLYRVIPAYKYATKCSDMRPIYTLFAAAFNLVTYILASNVLGAFWYLTAVERNMDCWRETCHKNRTTCNGSFLYCDDTSSYKTYLHKNCSTNSFDYGIYDEAFKTNIIEKGVPFLNKFFKCLWWGLQNLSTLGQNLKASNYIWDSFFAAFIAIVGLVLFALLIGNMQAYLKTIWSKQTFEEQDPAKVEKMKQRTCSLNGWTPFYLLPLHLRREVSKCNDPRWQETTEVNLESLLNNVQPTLRRKLKPHLCKDMFSKIPEFKYLSHRQQAELCALAKPVVFPERSYIFREGEPILEVVFIVDGSLWSYRKLSTETGIPAKQLSAGCFCGEELLQQLKLVAQQQQTPNESLLDLPIASKTIQTATKVEAFALPAKDLIKAFGSHNKLAATIKNAWQKWVEHTKERRILQ